MTTWVLVLFFHVGAMGDGNSNATATITGFANVQECKEAGNEANKLVSGTVKEVRFICVKQTKPITN